MQNRKMFLAIDNHLSGRQAISKSGGRNGARGAQASFRSIIVLDSVAKSERTRTKLFFTVDLCFKIASPLQNYLISGEMEE